MVDDLVYHFYALTMAENLTSPEQESIKKGDSSLGTPSSSSTPKTNKGSCINCKNPTCQQKLIQELILNEIQLQEEKKKLSEENTELKSQLSVSQQHLEDTQTELRKTRKEVNEMMARISHVLKRDNRGGIESPSDPFTPMKIAKELENLFNHEAVPIVAMFGDSEIDGIKFISGIMKKSYEFCKTRANVQMLSFTPLFPLDENYKGDDETMGQERDTLKQALTEADINELYLLRWKAAISEENRNRIKKDFTDFIHLKINENIKQMFQNNDSIDAVEHFIAGCAEISWLISTCHPSLTLRFDVIDKMHEKEIQSHFKKYTTKTQVTMQNRSKGYITCLVWPALLTTNKGNLLQCGEVITVDDE